MARKSKRMAFNEAIRQGQAKIADGLKTGQTRSDVQSARKVEKDEGGLLSPGNAARNPVDKCRELFLKSKGKSTILGQFPPKMRLIALLCAASIVVLALGIWLFSLVGVDQLRTSKPQKNRVSDTVFGKNEQEKGNLLAGRDSSGSVDSESSEKESLLPPSGGDNVIWIQSIPLGREDELAPLKEFFGNRGIQTEIIEIMGSNRAALVTMDGFEKNPSAMGTEGYKLLGRIKQLGTVYVEETKDTKFGSKPFQDALGYKR